MPGAGTYVKMAAAGISLCIGGPALVYYVTPTEEELFKRYNPDLQRRSLENRIGKQQDFDDFVCKLKEYSKSDKPIWAAQAEAEEKLRQQKRDNIVQEKRSAAAEVERRRQEMLNSTTSG